MGVAALSTTRPALAHYESNGRQTAPGDLGASVTRLRKQFLEDFDAAYVDNVIVPHFLVSTYHGERPSMPMIDVTSPKKMHCLLTAMGHAERELATSPEHGSPSFCKRWRSAGRQPPQATHERGYARSLPPHVQREGGAVLCRLLDAKNAGKPLMRPYLRGYWDLYWDLHLGVQGEAVPQKIRQVGNSFNTVLAYRDPTQKVVYDNYITVRSNLSFLKSWIDKKLDDLKTGRIPAPEKTFAHYWIKNGGDGDDFKRKDVVFECFHNFVAFSQWGNTLYNIMLKLSRNHGDPDAQDWFRKTMEGNFDEARGTAFTPLERFVMELFRVISPNGGSISL
jgi:hypothetical protein